MRLIPSGDSTNSCQSSILKTTVPIAWPHLRRPSPAVTDAPSLLSLNNTIVVTLSGRRVVTPRTRAGAAIGRVLFKTPPLSAFPAKAEPTIRCHTVSAGSTARPLRGGTAGGAGALFVVPRSWRWYYRGRGTVFVVPRAEEEISIVAPQPARGFNIRAA